MFKKIIFPLFLILSISLTAFFVSAAINPNLPETGKDSTGNPDDGKEYISVTDNEIGGKEYKWTTGKETEGTPYVKPKLGDTFEYGDYIYTFGKYFAPPYAGASPTVADNWSVMNEITSKGDGWEDDEEFFATVGWGCAAKTNKAEYDPPLGCIREHYVTHLNYCYYFMTQMKELPRLPLSVVSTGGMCRNCSGLVVADLSGVKNIGALAFDLCSKLQYVYISDATETISNNYSFSSAGYSAASPGKIYCSAAEGKSGWASGWNGTYLSVQYGVDRVDWLDIQEERS